MFKFWLILLLIVELVFPFACQNKVSQEKISLGLDSSFTRYSYKNENSEMIVIVDVELAHLRQKENYFPLDIKIANKSLYSLTLTREAFLLLDEREDSYPLATIKEIQKNYSSLYADSRYSYDKHLIGGNVLTSFSFFRRERSNFFPLKPGGARVTELVILPQKSYIIDRLYFPKPPSGIKGKILKLRIDAPELEYPFEVRFMVK